MPAPLPTPAQPAPDSDGYVEGQRDRALVLDLRVDQHRKMRADQSNSHPAYGLNRRDFDAAQRWLLAKDLVRYDPRRVGQTVPTPAGLAVHSAAQRALDDIASTIAGGATAG